MSFIFQRQILEDFFVEKALFSARSVHVYLQILFCPLDKIRNFFDLMETNSYLTAVEQYNLHLGKTQRNTKRQYATQYEPTSQYTHKPNTTAYNKAKHSTK